MVRYFTVVRVVRDMCTLCNSLLTIVRDGITWLQLLRFVYTYTLMKKLSDDEVYVVGIKVHTPLTYVLFLQFCIQCI